VGIREEVAAGLGRPQKELSPKFFYDRRGSELFEEITQLPEYYPARAERALLEDFVPGWIAARPAATLVELGAGAAAKTRILLDAMLSAAPCVTYVPIDISAGFLRATAAALRTEFPGLQVHPIAADLSTGLPPTPDLPGPALFAFLGGTIGNFPPGRDTALLGQVSAAMTDRDRLLLGVDLVKPVEVLERAYNDTAGVTAEFNLNVLRVLNREIGSDFDPDGFRHHAFYDPGEDRIEMHLVATRPMVVNVPDAGSFALEEGESIRTEISRKFDRERVTAMFRTAGLRLERWRVGKPGFALATAIPGEAAKRRAAAP
jgi:L-histidine Nalpha-methyltransferase